MAIIFIFQSITIQNCSNRESPLIVLNYCKPTNLVNYSVVNRFNLDGRDE